MEQMLNIENRTIFEGDNLHILQGLDSYKDWIQKRYISSIWSRCKLKGLARVEDLFSQLFGMATGGALVFWYHTVRRFPIRLSLFHFVLAIICLLLGFTFGVEIVKVVYTAFASLFVLIATVYLMIKNDARSEADVDTWTTALTVLMWITGVLTLGMDYANTKHALNPLIIGMAASLFSYIFRKRSRRNREENL